VLQALGTIRIRKVKKKFHACVPLRGIVLFHWWWHGSLLSLHNFTTVPLFESAYTRLVQLPGPIIIGSDYFCHYTNKTMEIRYLPVYIHCNASKSLPSESVFFGDDKAFESPILTLFGQLWKKIWRLFDQVHPYCTGTYSYRFEASPTYRVRRFESFTFRILNLPVAFRSQKVDTSPVPPPRVPVGRPVL